MDITKEREIKIFNGDSWESRWDKLVIETDLKIILNGVELVNVACSPQDTIQLAIGYLLSEGYLKTAADIKSLDADDPCCIRIDTNTEPDLTCDSIRVNSCLGRGRIHQDLVPLADGKSINYLPAHVLKIINELDATSHTFQQTGGVHSAGLANNRQLLFRFEDIGRHNAVDKVIGQAFLQQIDLEDKCLLLSGRIAAEILIKAASNGIPFVLSRSAPTLMALEKADELGLTVVGFARGHRFNLYCQGKRISFD